MIFTTTAPTKPFGPARVPCYAFCAAWLVAKLASSCPTLGLLLPFKQDFCQRLLFSAFFSFAQMCAA
jgi:hypothetical protein